MCAFFLDLWVGLYCCNREWSGRVVPRWLQVVFEGLDVDLAIDVRLLLIILLVHVSGNLKIVLAHLHSVSCSLSQLVVVQWHDT